MMKRWLKWIGLSLVAVLLLGLLYGALVVRPRIQSKTEAYHAVAVASYERLVEEVAPEAQFESHTCGLHTLRSIYRAYGLDPDEENLRVRLGVDVPTNPADRSSTGTLQPDLLRVLEQDGFVYELIDLEQGRAAERAWLGHLGSGHLAAVLIRRPQTGGMHWVVADRLESGKVMIADSLEPDPYLVDPRGYLEDCVLSVILMAPGDEGASGEASGWMLDGAGELLKTVKRYSERW